jgi:hypothetical protein
MVLMCKTAGQQSKLCLFFCLIAIAAGDFTFRIWYVYYYTATYKVSCTDNRCKARLHALSATFILDVVHHFQFFHTQLFGNWMFFRHLPLGGKGFSHSVGLTR